MAVPPIAYPADVWSELFKFAGPEIEVSVAGNSENEGGWQLSLSVGLPWLGVSFAHHIYHAGSYTREAWMEIVLGRGLAGSDKPFHCNAGRIRLLSYEDGGSHGDSMQTVCLPRDLVAEPLAKALDEAERRGFEFAARPPQKERGAYAADAADVDDVYEDG